MYRLFWAAVLVSIEKKYPSTTRLMGPPPMPKKLDITPSARPISTPGAAPCTLMVRMFALRMV